MSIIIKPVVTEKMTEMAEKLNRYAFLVNPSSNKIEIKKAVEAMFDVEVVAVNTMNHIGKSKARFTKAGVLAGRTKATKKAIVTLKDGDEIDFYSNI